MQVPRQKNTSCIFLTMQEMPTEAQGELPFPASGTHILCLHFYTAAEPVFASEKYVLYFSDDAENAYGSRAVCCHFPRQGRTSCACIFTQQQNRYS